MYVCVWLFEYVEYYKYSNWMMTKLKFVCERFPFARFNVLLDASVNGK